MKAKVITIVALLVLGFQNCGGMKAELFASEGQDCPDCGQTCDASESLEIQSEINGTNLSLDLVVADGSGLLQNAPAQWSVQDQTGRVITQSRTESTESFFVDLRTVAGCKVFVSAQSSENSCSQNLQKQIQIANCTGNEIVTTTTQRQNPYVTTTTLPRPTTTTLPNVTTTTVAQNPTTRSGPEIVGGCQPQYTVNETEYSAVFGAWSGTSGRRRLTIPQGVTSTFRFVTFASPSQLNFNEPGWGSMHALSEIPYSGDGNLLMTISTTRGCVDVTKLDPRCVSVAINSSLGWHVRGDSGGLSCPLEFGKQYYFNFTYGTRTSPGGPKEPYCPADHHCSADFLQIVQ